MVKRKKKSQYNKSKKRQYNKRQRRTNKLKRVGGAVHEREDLPHYHLQVKLDKGPVATIGTRFARTTPARPDDNSINNISVVAATVADVIEGVLDVDRRWLGGRGAFTLFWKGRALTDPKLKIRKIIVDGEHIPQYDDMVYKNEVIYAIPNTNLVESYKAVYGIDIPFTEDGKPDLDKIQPDIDLEDKDTPN